jgi:replicative DNA helicase
MGGGIVPPQAPSEEEAVIIALLYHGGHISRISGILKAEMFYRDGYSAIYGAVLSLHNAGAHIDLLSVGREMERQGGLKDAGSRVELERMAERFIASGTTAFLEDQARAIRSKYILREMIRLSTELIRASHDETLDIQDVYGMHIQAMQDVGTLIAGSDSTVTMKEMLKDAYSAMFERIDKFKNSVSQGIDTGIVLLNKYTGGWQPGNLVVIAGRPSMGKTALALHFARTAGMKGEETLFFSLEMTPRQLADRLILSNTSIDGNSYRTGSLTEDDVGQVDASISILENARIVVDRNVSAIPSYIRSRVREQAGRGCRMVIIDYLGLVSPENRNRSFSRDNEIGEITRALKVIAMENDIPVLLLCQLNRECEGRANKKPQLSDLRDSGNIEQDADVVLMVFRPSYYFSDADMPQEYCFPDGSAKRNYGQIIIAKNRNGVTGCIGFGHNDTITAVYDWDNEWQESRKEAKKVSRSVDYMHEPDRNDAPF